MIDDEIVTTTGLGKGTVAETGIGGEKGNGRDIKKKTGIKTERETITKTGIEIQNGGKTGKEPEREPEPEMEILTEDETDQEAETVIMTDSGTENELEVETEKGIEKEIETVTKTEQEIARTGVKVRSAIRTLSKKHKLVAKGHHMQKLLPLSRHRNIIILQ